MSIYIAVDGGTTNTRLTLVKAYNIIDTVKINIGARKCIEGTEPLKAEIKNGIEKLLETNGISTQDVRMIVASGMITSDFGLCPLPHITAPAGISELHDSMYEMKIPEITEIPFTFIRGVKADGADLSDVDIMRGEETELVGIINERGNTTKSCAYILPGSHSKVVYTDEGGRITKFETMLTGEMIGALAKNTILASSVDLSDAGLSEEYLYRGFEFCRKHGINKALFKVRVLDTIFKCTKNELYSFFMGITLHGEVESIINSDAEAVVIGGKAEIKRATELLLKKYYSGEVVTLFDTAVERSTAIGAVRIFENK